jgi:hypothetical protein
MHYRSSLSSFSTFSTYKKVTGIFSLLECTLFHVKYHYTSYTSYMEWTGTVFTKISQKLLITVFTATVNPEVGLPTTA